MNRINALEGQKGQRVRSGSNIPNIFICTQFILAIIFFFFHFAGAASLVKIHSLNVNGLEKKIIKTIDFFRVNKIDILCLQEIHKISNLTNISQIFDQYGLKIEINKTYNTFERGNYNGTAFVYKKRFF